MCYLPSAHTAPEWRVQQPDGCWLRIPAENYKTGLEHIVPLTALALEQLPAVEPAPCSVEDAIGDRSGTRAGVAGVYARHRYEDKVRELAEAVSAHAAALVG